MATKITKREVINSMLTNEVILENATWVAYLENELAILDKKKSSGKTSAKTEANNDLKAVILSALGEVENPVSISELQSLSDELKAYSNQKISALMRQLVADNEVVKSTDKKKSVFALS